MNFLCSFSLPRSRDAAKGAAPQKREHPLSLSLFAQYTKLHDVLDTKLASCLAKKSQNIAKSNSGTNASFTAVLYIVFSSVGDFFPRFFFPPFIGKKLEGEKRGKIIWRR